MRQQEHSLSFQRKPSQQEFIDVGIRCCAAYSWFRSIHEATWPKSYHPHLPPMNASPKTDAKGTKDVTFLHPNPQNLSPTACRSRSNWADVCSSFTNFRELYQFMFRAFVALPPSVSSPLIPSYHSLDRWSGPPTTKMAPNPNSCNDQFYGLSPKAMLGSLCSSYSSAT